jgi:transposase
MLYAGLDLSRQRLDVHVLDVDGRTVEVTAVRPDAGALRALPRSRASPRSPPRPIGSMPGSYPELARLDLVPAIWLPDPVVRAERERARFRLHLSHHRTALKNRIHAMLMTFGQPVPMADLFGAKGRELLAGQALPRAVDGDAHHQPGHDRRARRADRRLRGGARGRWRPNIRPSRSF